MMNHSNNNSSPFYDNNFVRYRLAKTNPGENLVNWIFLPGGPGADSSYYLTLIEKLTIPGKFWLIDFPANGNNVSDTIKNEYDFNLWYQYLIPAIERFEKPILVGQSFGGMFPLLFPELEKMLLGFVILNSAPRMYSTEAVKYATQRNISISSDAGTKFKTAPSEETFRAALLANAHCHFPKNSLAAGRKLFEELPFNYQAMLWWLKESQEINFNAKWIPQTIPTLIMGGTHDFVVPCGMFETDKRFHRSNIQIITVDNAGHFIWFDQMPVVDKYFKEFLNRIKN